MRGLRVVPSGRPGRGRLYVNLPDGRAVAWYDRQANRISVLADDQRDAVVRVLRPFLTAGVSIGPPPVPTAAELRGLALPPDEDLAPNRPGESLLGELDHGTAGTRARHRLRQDLAAQQRSGDAFDALEAHGWRVLHCVPLPGLGRIDHLLIGPAGIFCVRTVPGRRQRAAVGDLLIAVGRAEPRPDPRWARRAAARAELALTTRAAADGTAGRSAARPAGGRAGRALSGRSAADGTAGLPSTRPAGDRTECARTPRTAGVAGAAGVAGVAGDRTERAPHPRTAGAAGERTERALSGRSAADGTAGPVSTRPAGDRTEGPLSTRPGGNRTAGPSAARAIGGRTDRVLTPRVTVTGALAVADASRVEVAPTVRDLRVLQPGTAAPELGSLPVVLEPSEVEALFTLARDTRTWL
ncbi:nuclease-related domain-containing protein [Streptomyces sp. NPDC058611]|uniref:nuclease-related domain-containing protein n=1 Tax=unclassified Streptomyces TaxID=2593676 RepID=UPI003653DAEA